MACFRAYHISNIAILGQRFSKRKKKKSLHLINLTVERLKLRDVSLLLPLLPLLLQFLSPLQANRYKICFLILFLVANIFLADSCK